MPSRKTDAGEVLLTLLWWALIAALFYLIGESVYRSFLGHHSFRWPLGLLSVAYLLLFAASLFTVKAMRAEARLFLTAAFFLALMLISTLLYGTESHEGFMVQGRPVSFVIQILYGIIITGSVILVLSRPLHGALKILVTLAALYGLAGIVEAVVRNYGIETVLAGAGFSRVLPFYLKPLCFAFLVYVPLVVVALFVAIGIRLARRTTPAPALFFLALSLLAAALIGIAAFAVSSHPEIKAVEGRAVKGRVNLLSSWQGGEVVSFSSQRDRSAWAAANLNDGRIASHDEEGGWSSTPGAPFPHEIVMALPPGEGAPIDELTLYNGGSSSAAVKDFEVFGQVSPSKEWTKLGKFKADKSGQPQVFPLKPVKVTLLKVVISSNHGDGGATTLYEIEAAGRAVPLASDPAGRNLMAEEEGAQAVPPASEGFEGYGNLIKGEQGGNLTINEKTPLPCEVILGFARGASAPVGTVLVTFPREAPGVKDFELSTAESPRGPFRKAGRYTKPADADEMKCSFSPRVARYVKLRVLATHGGKPAAIARVKAFSPPVAVKAVEPSPGGGLAASYYNGYCYKDLAAERIDSTVDFTWASAPCQGLTTSRFAVVWRGYLTVPADGLYEVAFKADDGFRLTLDGVAVMENWDSRSLAFWNKKWLSLAKGAHPVTIAYCNREYPAGITMAWRRPGEASLVPVPEKAFSCAAGAAQKSRSPREAAQDGILWLEPQAARWQNKEQCYGCHVQTQALMGFAIAKKNEYTVSSASMAALEGFLLSGIKPDGGLSFPHSDNVTAAQFLAMALACHRTCLGMPYEEPLVRVSGWLLGRQDASGSFPCDRPEAPIQQGSVMATTNALLALSGAYESTGDRRYRDGLERGVQWLRAAKIETTQDAVFQVIGLAALDREESRRALKNSVLHLYSLQKPDGGWSEVPGLGSNGYATGQALYALKSAGASIADERFSRGVEYLLGTQQVFGSWASMNSQSKRPSDYAPTMWAVIGLAGSFEKFIVNLKVPAEGERFKPGAPPSHVEAAVFNETGSPVKEVQFFLDGKSLGKAAASPYTAPWSPGALAPGPHTLKVTGLTAGGHSSSDEAEVSLVGKLAIAIETPKASETLAGRVVITSTVANETGSPLKEVEYFLDGSSLGHTVTPPFAMEKDLRAVPPGRHVLRAVATTAEGEVAFAEQDNPVEKALVAEITSPGEGALLDEELALRSLVKNLTASPVEHVEYSCKGMPLGSSKAPPYEVKSDSRKLPDGPYLLRALAVTEAGDTAEAVRNIEISHRFPVTFYATVVDEKGKPITNLASSDFSLFEAGKAERDLVVTRTTEETALSVVILLDGSGSMKGSTDEVKKAARLFITLLSPKDRAALIFFSDRVTVTAPFTREHGELEKAVSKLSAEGGTALYDSIYKASMLLAAQKDDRKAIILLTDGVDENGPGTAPGSMHTFSESLACAKEKGTIIYPIGIGSGIDTQVLSRLAAATGGRPFFQHSARELGEAYRQIAHELRCQYAISYFPLNRKKDGTWRPVKITTPGKGFTVHTKEGYYAPRY
ncbi:MAG: VWA domain-containing protein [Candidatus Eremiobacteraeota bacterium]|nr:VWA domain-containing protein [Candidatus Eremiobacteraeota bacterium]